MKIFVHDFAGHPFQIQLSTELARRGHSVVHAYFADIPGPKGKFAASRELPNLQVEPIHVTRQFSAYSYFQRMVTHREYAGIVASKIRDFQPDVVLSGNTPTDAQYLLNRECKRQNIRFIHWMQDFYALALEALLTRKLGSAGGKICALPFHLLERNIFKTSDAVVYISDDFASYAARQNYSPNRSVVIENWASLDDLPVRAKDNEWARKNNLHDKFVFLYSGTMGLKHNPNTLLQLAHRFKLSPDVRVALVSQGIGRDFLEAAKKKENLDNLVLLDFEPYAKLPEVLASADVLLASVEPDAGAFCVPSKILSYMCSARPILMSVSPQNLAARIVTRSDSGYVTAPGDDEEFANRAIELYENRQRCREMAGNARRYAESTFDIDQIGSIFEAVLRGEGEEMTAVSSPIPMRTSS
jgi:glycosyltransferase involved in cell wall biosynthesis